MTWESERKYDYMNPESPYYEEPWEMCSMCACLVPCDLLGEDDVCEDCDVEK